MNVLTVNNNQIEQAVQFLYELNNESKHHIGYCGKNKIEIKSSVEELMKDGNEFFVCCDENKIIGIMGYEKYDSTVEIWGPYIREYDENILNILWDKIVCSVNEKNIKYNIHCNMHNEIAKQFAIEKGFEFFCEGVTMQIDLSNVEIPSFIDIFSANEYDYGEFEALHKLIFPNAYYNSREIIEMLGSDYKLLIAKEKNKVVGYIFISLNLEINEGYIDFVGVNSSCRRKGYGKKLLYSALKTFKENGINELQLWVNVVNENAISLYKNVGFQIVDRLIGYKI